MRVTILLATAAAFCFSAVSAQAQSPKDRAIALAVTQMFDELFDKGGLSALNIGIDDCYAKVKADKKESTFKRASRVQPCGMISCSKGVTATIALSGLSPREHKVLSWYYFDKWGSFVPMKNHRISCPLMRWTMQPSGCNEFFRQALG